LLLAKHCAVLRLVSVPLLIHDVGYRVIVAILQQLCDMCVDPSKLPSEMQAGKRLARKCRFAPDLLGVAKGGEKRLL